MVTGQEIDSLWASSPLNCYVLLFAARLEGYKGSATILPENSHRRLYLFVVAVVVFISQEIAYIYRRNKYNLNS